jgi:CRP-like cAMP-binding protein
VKPVLYNPNMILCIKGKYAMQMAYIIQGEVLVRSKYKSDKPAAILRPGCIFGEMNLFFSYPYTTNVETRTSCQLLLIEKEALFELLSLYPSTLKILRGRVQVRFLRNYS